MATPRLGRVIGPLAALCLTVAIPGSTNAFAPAAAPPTTAAPPSQPPRQPTAPTQPAAPPKTQPPPPSQPTAPPAQPPAQPSPPPKAAPTQPAPAPAPAKPAAPPKAAPAKPKPAPAKPAAPKAAPAKPAAQPKAAPAQPPVRPKAPPSSGAETPQPGAAPAGVGDAAWNAMIDKDVVVVTNTGAEVEGKLISAADDSAVIVQPDGLIVTVPKANATQLRIDAPRPKEEPKPEANKDDKKKKKEEKQDDKPKEEEKEEYKKLGLFTSHGVAYAHWRTPHVGSGKIAYALDAAVGFNFSAKFGIYALLGGHVGARIENKDVKANVGHFAMSFRIKRKFIAFIPGIGVGWGGLKGPLPTDAPLKNRERQVGLAIPIKLMGAIPLPKDLFLGIGVGYTFEYLGTERFFNGISGQLTLGRW